MAIVARRVLQRLIQENAAFTSREQRLRQAIILDRATDDSLSTEWEILVLNGLAKLSKLHYEVSMGGRRPDILAELGFGKEAERFVADVATAFETGYHDRNPIETLNEEIHLRARRLGLVGGFDVRVEGEMRGRPGKAQMILKLPGRPELPEFLRGHIDPFLADCAREPNRPRSLVLRESNAHLTIDFRPGVKTSLTSHPSFTTRYSRTRNSVFNLLKRKARQLRDTGFSGPRGVIICAADADLRSSESGGHGLRSITEDVFRQNPSLSFVLTLWSRDPVFDHAEYQSELYLSSCTQHPLGPLATDALRTLHTVLPEPRNSGRNALYELRFWRWKRGRYFYGSWKMSQSTVEISARVLLQYLAGRIDRDEFLLRHGGDQGFVSLFEQKLRRGQLLVGAEIKHMPDRDDDWVVFRFGQPDPAIAPMRPEQPAVPDV